MTTLSSARPPPASTAAPRSPARPNMPPSSTSPTSPTASSSPRPSPRAASRASTPAAALAVDGRDRRAHPREPAADGGHRQGLQRRLAPAGSPFRPLYDDKIKFSGQPIALVVAEEFETARFAATLVRVEYEAGSSRHRPACAARQGLRRREARQAARRCARRPYAAAAVRHEAEYFIPTEHHNPMELFAATVVWDGDGKLTVYDKTQGVQNVQRYVCSVFGLNADDVRVHVALRRRRVRLGPAAAIPGGARGAGGALKLKRSVRVVLTRAADVWPRLPARDDRAGRARRQGRRHARRDHPRGDRDDLAIRGFSRNDIVAGRRCSTSAPTRTTSTSWRGSTCRRPADMRAPGATTGVYALECAMDELAVALKMDPLRAAAALLFRPRPEPGHAVHQQGAAECYRQGAEAFGWDKRKPEPRSMRDGSELVGWGMATGIWEALQMPMASPHRADRQRPRRGLVRHRPTSAPAPTRSWRRSRPTCWACRSRTSRSSSAIRRCRNRRSKAARGRPPRSAHAIAAAADEVRKELLGLAQKIAELAARRCAAGRCDPCGRHDRQQGGRRPRGVDR